MLHRRPAFRIRPLLHARCRCGSADARHDSSRASPMLEASFIIITFTRGSELFNGARVRTLLLPGPASPAWPFACVNSWQHNTMRPSPGNVRTAIPGAETPSHSVSRCVPDDGSPLTSMRSNSNPVVVAGCLVDAVGWCMTTNRYTASCSLLWFKALSCWRWRCACTAPRAALYWSTGPCGPCVLRRRWRQRRRRRQRR